MLPLPIGSIVRLQTDGKKYMVLGVQQLDAEQRKWDYCGCFYPAGVQDTSLNTMFNHDQIVQLLFIGYQGPEQGKFMNFLEKNGHMEI